MSGAAVRSPTLIAAALAFGALAAPAPPAAAAELCRYVGTTDYDGKVSIRSQVSAADGLITVDVAVTFAATTALWLHVHYLVEEISTWRAGALRSVAVNTRYLVGEHIVRQQWDAFRAAAAGLEAQRVQSKTIEEFRRKHPNFVQHWDPARFGDHWTQDYPQSGAERRPDLDLAAQPLPAGLRSPLALAFYWIRWTPPGGVIAPVFLPGFKAESLFDVPIIPGTPRPDGKAGDQDTRWRAPLVHPWLNPRRASTAEVVVSPDHHLRHLAFDLHAPGGDAGGAIEASGCEGAPVNPGDLQP